MHIVIILKLHKPEECMLIGTKQRLFLNPNTNPDQLYIIYYLLSSCVIDFLDQLVLS